jgi:TPR repeat protein
LSKINNYDYNLNNDLMLTLICYHYGHLYQGNLIFDKRIEECLIKTLNFTGNFYLYNSNIELFERCIGLILFTHEENIDIVTEYYNIAISKNNINAIISFASYLRYYRHNQYDLMKKYYELAISLGSVEAMFLLGDYYDCICEGNNTELMKKYYLMAIDNKHVKSMEALALHYKSKLNYFLMKKYYLMAIDNGSHNVMYLLGKFYENKEIRLMIKFYEMYINTDCNHLCKDNTSCRNKNLRNGIIQILADYYESICDIKNMQKYYLLISDQI